MAPCSDPNLQKRLNSNNYRKQLSGELVTSLATAMSLLYVCHMESLCYNSSRMMYMEAVSLAQAHNLFPTDDGYEALGDLLHGVSELEKWKAWTRVESTKRLCVFVLMGNAMFSHKYEARPTLHFDLMKGCVPCELESFEAPDPAAWWKSLIKSRSSRVTLHTLSLPQSIGNYEMHGLLAICWAQVSQGQHHRLENDNDLHRTQSSKPPRLLVEDPENHRPASVLSGLYNVYKEAFVTLNPNCLVSLHNTCMTLAADILLLQDAAGRNGAARARDARKMVAKWSPNGAKPPPHGGHAYTPRKRSAS